jgi:hypothetical protein
LNVPKIKPTAPLLLILELAAEIQHNSSPLQGDIQHNFFMILSNCGAVANSTEMFWQQYAW